MMNLRTTGLLLLLPSEGILLGVLFDAESLARLPRGWWSPVGQIAPKVLPVAICIATSGLLLAGPHLHDQFSRRPPTRAPRGWVGGFLAAHLLAFAALFVLTSALFTGRPALPDVGAVVAAWATAAALTGLFWAATLVPPAALGLLASRSWALLAASAACGLLAWAAGAYTQHWWGPLRRGTLLIAALLLHAVDPTAWSDPAHYLIGARHFDVVVNYQCSGYEGIGLTWIALTAWLVLYRPHLRPVTILLILLPAATVAVYLANAVRIAALVYVGAHWSADVALGGFHSTAGALLFSGIVLATAWTARHLPIFTTDLPPRPHERGVNPAAPYLVPLLAFTAAALLTGLFTRDHDPSLYPVPVAVGLAALWPYRHEYRRLEWRLTLTPLLTGALVFGVWLALAGTLDDPTYHVTSITPRWRLPWLACRTLGAVAIVPLAEELAFRGYLARRLMSHDFWKVPLTQLSWPAVLISSLLFGALHQQQFIAGTAAGLAYALLARHRGRLTDAVLAHALTNALLAAGAIAVQFHA
jgi:exosortase E/protease (VPEID-CTERM system)